MLLKKRCRVNDIIFISGSKCEAGQGWKEKENLEKNESYQYLSFGPLTKVSTKLVQI